LNHGELGDRVDGGRGENERRARQHRPDHDRLAAEAIGKRPANQDAEYVAGTEDRKRRPEGAGRNAQRLGDVGGDVAEREIVETAGEAGQRAKQEHSDLKTAERPRFDEVGDVDGPLPRHFLSRRHVVAQFGPEV